MKTGIVMQIKGGLAVVMKTGGEFVEVRAKTGWRKGDVVTLKSDRPNIKALYAVVACFAVFVLVMLSGHRLYFTEASLISLDINPSIELSINRFGKVISVMHYNEDAAELINVMSLKGLSYQQAIDILLQSDTFRHLLQSNEYLEFAVYSKDNDMPIIRYLNECAEFINGIYPGIQVNCSIADGDAAYAAHCHRMSIGKYLAFLELLELEPEAKVEDYTNCGIDELRKQICHRYRYRNGNGNGNGNCNGDGSGNCNEGGNGSGNRRGNGGGNCDGSCNGNGEGNCTDNGSEQEVFSL